MSDVQEIVRNQMQPLIKTEVVVPVEKKSSNGVAILGVIIILLTLCIVGATYYKKVYLPSHTTDTCKITPETKDVKVQPDFTNRIKEIERKLSVHEERIWLLGVSHNENVNVQLEIERRRGIEPNFIYFDNNWKLNKIPQTMPIDKDDFKGYVK